MELPQKPKILAAFRFLFTQYIALFTLIHSAVLLCLDLRNIACSYDPVYSSRLLQKRS
jgi:hypothetical protein